MSKKRIVLGRYVSVGGNGTEVSANCKVNLKTHEVFDIEDYENLIGRLKNIEDEYVIVDGITFPVVSREEYREANDESLFWTM
jgi:hypothetical protein